MKEKYFITADPHGFTTLLKDALNAKGFDENNPEHKLIICGDLFDRGEEPVEIYNFVKSLGDRFIYVRGNHEDLIFDCVNDLIENEGVAGYYHYSNGTVDTVSKLKKAGILNEVLDFINEKSVNYFELDNYIFVHGWIPCVKWDVGYKKHSYEPYDNWRDASTDLWKKARWINGMDAWNKGIKEPDKTIVCGHFHCSWGWSYLKHERKEFPQKNRKDWEKSFEPFIEDGIIDLDACTAYSKLINILVIEK